MLDDTQACVNTLNLMLEKRARPKVTLEFFRENFTFPARRFYRLLGMDVPDSEWDALAKEYHDTYALQPKRIHPEAVAALEYAKAKGVGQSIISALRQDLLDADVEKYAVKHYFDCIYGSDNLDGASKLDRALELMTRLDGVDPVVIGDSFHDKEIADALKVRCVLCGTGSHSARRLRSVAPTGDTLLEAVKLALGDIN